MTRLILALPLTCLALLGCGNDVDPALCLGSTCVAVATSKYNADFTGQGTLNSVDLASRAPRVGIDATLDPDTTMRIIDDELFVLQRTTGALRIYDPKTFAVKAELPVGDADHPAGKSLPQDFVVREDRIFVSLAGNDAEHALAVLDRAAPGTVAWIGLPQDAADTDGRPEPARIHECDGKLYVALQSYVVENFQARYQKGRIAIVDPDARIVRAVIPLAGKNPYDIAALGGDCNDVVVASSATLFTEPDGEGNLERVDLSTATSRGVLMNDQGLGGRPTYLAAAAADLLYVGLYFDPQPTPMGMVFLSSVKVIAFDPQKKAIRNDVTGKFGQVNFVRVHDDRLFIGAGVFADMEDPQKGARGLYVAPADGNMVSGPPIDLSLTPSAIALP
jgi:hypothetical protein